MIKNYLDVAGQVKKVVSVGEVEVNFIRQVLNGVLVGDVAHHESGSGIVPDRQGVDFEAVAVEVSQLAIDHVLGTGHDCLHEELIWAIPEKTLIGVIL